MAAISEDELHRRVPASPTGDEIQHLADTMNAMLSRLEDAYARQSRFVSDASHELKSPIAALRAHLEVDLAHPEQADWLQSERAALIEVTALQRLVEDLLTLAGLPGGTRPLRHESVDLDDLVLREGERIRIRARVRVDLSNVSAGQVEGDPAQLARAVRNLLDNPERHAVSTVALSVRERNAAVEVEVADDGPGIPPPTASASSSAFPASTTPAPLTPQAPASDSQSRERSSSTTAACSWSRTTDPVPDSSCAYPGPRHGSDPDPGAPTSAFFEHGTDTDAPID